VITTILLYPVDNIKTKMQVSSQNGESSKAKADFMTLFLETIKNESFWELYTGLSADAVGNFISNGTYFFIYEKAKKKFNTKYFTGYVYAATVASSLTTVITNPFRVLNTKMIIKKKENESLKTKKKGAVGHTMEIYRNEGISGFFSGVASSLILIINPIINYVIYEYLKKFFKGEIS
jgi:adenine nucleotide transporter 17